MNPKKLKRLMRKAVNKNLQLDGLNQYLQRALDKQRKDAETRLDATREVYESKLRASELRRTSELQRERERQNAAKENSGLNAVNAAIGSWAEPKETSARVFASIPFRSADYKRDPLPLAGLAGYGRLSERVKEYAAKTRSAETTFQAQVSPPAEVPAGPLFTELAHAQDKSLALAVTVLAARLQANDDYAWGWFCNLAMASRDAGARRGVAWEGAARFLRVLADVDITKNPSYESFGDEDPPATTAPPPVTPVSCEAAARTDAAHLLDCESCWAGFSAWARQQNRPALAAMAEGYAEYLRQETERKKGDAPNAQS